MSCCLIDLLGPPRYGRTGSTFLPLKRKHALLLAYLALEGTTHRERLGELFWPDDDEKTRSSNLRQLLFQLRRRLGDEAFVIEDRTLALSAECSVDAARVLEAFKRKDWTNVIACPPHLLGTLDYEREPGLRSWLADWRQDFVRRHAAALGHEAARLDRQGDHADALRLAESRLRLERYGDEACRQVIALKLQLGDRIGALHVYDELRITLKQEVGWEPEPATTAMVDAVCHAGQRRPEPDVKQEVIIRYPPLMGRARAWGQLEEAWKRRVPIIYVCGHAGLGKSRLMKEFVERMTRGLYFCGSAWPGDASLPFGSRANTIRKILVDFPTLHLEPWVRRELGRILPELSADADGLEPPEPWDPAFVEANRWLYQWLGRHVCAIIFDDGQFLDHQTITLGLALEARLAPLVASGDFPPILVGIRPGQLAPEQEELLRQRAEMGQAAWIDLDPLTPDSARQLAASLGIPGIERIADQIVEAAGGSPYFIQEIVRELVSRADWNGSFPDDYRVASSVRDLLDRKVKRLSAEALRVAQVAALAGEGLSPVMLASVADQPLDHLTVCFRELERHRLFHGRWFASGAVAPAVVEGMTEAAHAELAKRIADWRQMLRHGALW